MLLLGLASGVAQADDTFTFCSTPTGPIVLGVPGCVTGEILGLAANGTSAATSILIESYPAGFVLFGNYTTPFDVFDWTGGTIEENSFTTVDGLITGGSFSITGANGVFDQLYIDSQCLCGVIGLPDTGTNFFNIGNNVSKYIWNSNGIGPSGVTFAMLGTTAVPEPATVWLLADGLALFAAFAGGSRRKQRPAIFRY